MILLVGGRPSILAAALALYGKTEAGPMFESISRFLAVAAALVEARGANAGVAEILRYGAVLTREGPDARERLDRVTEQVQAMIAEDRDPTETELATIREARGVLVDRIRNVDLGGDPGERSPT